MNQNHVLFIQWGAPVHGRESMSVEIFQLAVEYHMGLKNRGEIADYWTIGFEQGNLTNLAGCMVVTGTCEQLDTLWNSEKYRELRMKAQQITTNLSFTRGVTGELVMERVKETVAVRKSLGL